MSVTETLPAMRPVDVPEEVPAVTPKPGLRDLFQPRDFGELMKLAGLIAKSGLVPNAYKGKPDDLVVAAHFGSEVGLGLWQSLQSVCVINGRPALYGDAPLAVVRASGKLESIQEWLVGEGDNLEATCEVKRRGEPKSVRRTFTVAQAKRAKLWGKDGPWSQYSERMLLFRARGYALRDAFGDVLAGIATNDEWAVPTVAAEELPGAEAAEELSAIEPEPVELTPEALPVTCAACDAIVDPELLPWLEDHGWPPLCRKCGRKVRDSKLAELPKDVREHIEAAQAATAPESDLDGDDTPVATGQAQLL